MAFEGLPHLVNGTVDAGVRLSEPVVGVPADDPPHMFGTVELLLVDLTEHAPSHVLVKQTHDDAGILTLCEMKEKRFVNTTLVDTQNQRLPLNIISRP